MCQVTSIRYEMHKLVTWNSSWKTFTMMLPPHWLSCLLASSLPESIWKSEMLEICLEKPVFTVFVEQDYQQDQVVESISRLVSSIRERQIVSIKVFSDSRRFNSDWDEMPPLESHFNNKCACSAVDRGSWCQSFCWFPPTGGSMLISAVCCFFLFFGNSESAMIGWQCLFCGASIAAWNALDVITVELYPTDKRCSEYLSFQSHPLTLSS